MNHHFAHHVAKLENPERMAQLDPPSTLAQIGLTSDCAFCDIGAGTGIFTFAAAERTSGQIYAVDISDNMLEVLRAKNSFDHVCIENSIRKVPSNSCDLALLCAVLHEVSDTESLLTEIKRVLRKSGRLAIIEFHKSEATMGPPLKHRIFEEYAVELLQAHGFKRIHRFSLGEDLYGLVFELGGA